MNWLTGIVVYILVWWVTLFAILPLWVTRSGGAGFAAGAAARRCCGK
jgi:predicted secreted protein